MNGERNPSEVYVSFRDAVLRILGMPDGEMREHDVPRSLEAEVSKSSRFSIKVRIKKNLLIIYILCLRLKWRGEKNQLQVYR